MEDPRDWDRAEQWERACAAERAEIAEYEAYLDEYPHPPMTEAEAEEWFRGFE